MSFLKRLLTTFRARAVAGERPIEDDEPSPAMLDGRRHLARVRENNTKLVTAVDRLQSEAQRWEDRARRFAASDEPKALACVQRRNSAQRRADKAAATLREHRQLERCLEEEMRQSMSEMGVDRAKHVSVAAQGWEIRIAAAEIRIGALHGKSLSRTGHEREESECVLRRDLAALLKG
ncbi:phage shock protein A [Natronocella acetinitrilica]|uniref:Phage shock protein A n=1 Tax=Natronocella acetinitrilica TaxID=414046 RepID=A0AAE3KAA6_9GAMM|nr:hypothetical protein [Natronocella acetinitrilica]MCP1674000.1 phage shock protein A [Natronocella acetinitrilica]